MQAEVYTAVDDLDILIKFTEVKSCASISGLYLDKISIKASSMESCFTTLCNLFSVSYFADNYKHVGPVP